GCSRSCGRSARSGCRSGRRCRFRGRSNPVPPSAPRSIASRSSFPCPCSLVWGHRAPLLWHRSGFPEEVVLLGAPARDEQFTEVARGLEEVTACGRDLLPVGPEQTLGEFQKIEESLSTAQDPDQVIGQGRARVEDRE